MQNSTDSVYGVVHWHVFTAFSDGIQIPDTHAYMLPTYHAARARFWKLSEHSRHVQFLQCDYAACTKYGRFDAD